MTEKIDHTDEENRAMRDKFDRVAAEKIRVRDSRNGNIYTDCVKDDSGDRDGYWAAIAGGFEETFIPKEHAEIITEPKEVRRKCKYVGDKCGVCSKGGECVDEGTAEPKEGDEPEELDQEDINRMVDAVVPPPKEGTSLARAREHERLAVESTSNDWSRAYWTAACKDYKEALTDQRTRICDKLEALVGELGKKPCKDQKIEMSDGLEVEYRELSMMVKYGCRSARDESGRRITTLIKQIKGEQNENRD